MKSNINRANRIAKIKALAQRGIDGEQANAVSILRKLMKKETITVDTWAVGADGQRVNETYNFTRHNTAHDITIPYRQFVTSNRVWRLLGNNARLIIEQITGSITVQNWEEKITCSCTTFDTADIQQAVNTSTYKLLCRLKIPVIHNGGDKAGFPCDTDCMEDGTSNSIFQYKSCLQYVAPNMKNEIMAAMLYPEYNKFIALTDTVAVWGKVTAFDTNTGTITLTPLNPKYPASTLALSEIKTLYRVGNGCGWSMAGHANGEALKASQQRRAAAMQK